MAAPGPRASPTSRSRLKKNSALQCFVAFTCFNKLARLTLFLIIKLETPFSEKLSGKLERSRHLAHKRPHYLRHWNTRGSETPQTHASRDSYQHGLEFHSLPHTPSMQEIETKLSNLEDEMLQPIQGLFNKNNQRPPGAQISGSILRLSEEAVRRKKNTLILL